MSIDENRNCGCNSDLNENSNCGCGCNMNQNNDDNVSYVMNNTPNGYELERRIDCNDRRNMIDEIRSLEFAINELALYLDTHPDDEKALCLHRKYCKECKDLKDKYQKVYGPLTINYPCNKWRWLEEPWPWERGNF